MRCIRLRRIGSSFVCLTAVTFFALGGLVTLLFSGSLAVLAAHATLREVLIVGMVVPSFTWIVQLSLSAILLNHAARGRYWSALSRICLLGSVALLPAAAVNCNFRAARPIIPSR
jgi:hypothetical protein